MAPAALAVRSAICFSLAQWRTLLTSHLHRGRSVPRFEAPTGSRPRLQPGWEISIRDLPRADLSFLPVGAHFLVIQDLLIAVSVLLIVRLAQRLGRWCRACCGPTYGLRLRRRGRPCALTRSAWLSCWASQERRRLPAWRESWHRSFAEDLVLSVGARMPVRRVRIANKPGIRSVLSQAIVTVKVLLPARTRRLGLFVDGSATVRCRAPNSNWASRPHQDQDAAGFCGRSRWLRPVVCQSPTMLA